MITLLSDFGLKDAYVAAMKGAIASIAPGIPMCDITHLIPPQDILAARFNLMMAYPYFPVGTVHLAVVDPGVGTTRKAIALQTPSGFFVGPDNGLFSGVFDGVVRREPVTAAVHLTESRYWRSPTPSATFHGRDIFAPVAAHLAKGVPIESLGNRIDRNALVKANLPSFVDFSDCAPVDDLVRATGSLQYIDGFGNLITNIPARILPKSPWMLTVETPDGPKSIAGHATYGDVPMGTLAALVGSHGFVEVACNGGSALASLSASQVQTSASASVSAVTIGTAVHLAVF